MTIKSRFPTPMPILLNWFFTSRSCLANFSPSWLLGGCLWLFACLCQAASTDTNELTALREYFIPQPLTVIAAEDGSDPQTSLPTLEQQRLPAATTGAYWIHFTLLNRSTEQEWVLDISNALIPKLIVHNVNASLHQIREQGFQKTWPFDLRYGTSLQLPAGEITHIWLYVDNTATSHLPLLSVLPLRQYQQKSFSYSMHLLIILGALAVLALYQAVIFSLTRDGAYGWSIVAQLSATFAWAAQCKFLLYSLSLQAHWYWLYLPLYIALAAFTQFARHYLRLYLPRRLAHLLDGVSVLILLLGIGGALIPLRIYSHLLDWLAPMLFLLLLALGFLRWHSRSTITGHYLLAMGILLLGSLFYWLDQQLQLLIVENSILAAARLQLAALILFMMGLIDRAALLQKEGAKAQQANLMDSLTGLPNRTAFERDVRAWEAYCHEGIYKDFYLSFFEINSLPKVSRSKGRREGDRLLCLIGDWLLSQVENRHVYRISGNEFLVLSQKNIRWNLSALDLYLTQEGFRQIQIHIGTSCYSESSCRSSLLKIADARLHDKNSNPQNNGYS